jgi:acyl-CoA dehydrogenase
VLDATNPDLSAKGASSQLRRQSLRVTEPRSPCTDTTSLKTFARREATRTSSPAESLISRVQHSDLMVLLARTNRSRSEPRRPTDSSTFIVDLRMQQAQGLTIKPIDAMINHHSCELFFDDFKILAENLLGEAHRAFASSG